MKRRERVRHLERHGCAVLRDKGPHTVYVHRSRGKVSSVPRHRETNGFLARRICRDLEVPEP